MYCSRHIDINKKHGMYSYFDTVTALSNNLYNATLFRMRQVMTGIQKEESLRQENEKEVIKEIEKAIPRMFEGAKMPTAKNWFLSYKFLNSLFCVTQNPDYCAEGLPRQSAQQIIKRVTKDYKSYTRACRSYREDSSNFSGRPKLPRYKTSGGHSEIIFTNQDCIAYTDASGETYVKFPLIKQRLCVGKVSGKLKEVHAQPYYDKYRVFFIFDDGCEIPEIVTSSPKRAIAIDLGVSNFAAITNNIGEPSMLYKGGVIKSANQFYNKQLAKIMSKETKGNDIKFKPTNESIALTRLRDNTMDDFMHKVSKSIVSWCVDKNIDTVIIGENKGWKDKVNIGKENNQMFVQIPFTRFKNMMSYLCEKNGIRLVFQEESYTSKASFRARDFIPVYGENGADQVPFSGRRKPTKYKGNYKKDGFRGLYQDYDGTIINSDLNGSANIGRKAFPTMFDNDGKEPDFTDVIIIPHPDYDGAKNLKEKQLATHREMSKSKERRLRRKALKTQM